MQEFNTIVDEKALFYNRLISSPDVAGVLFLVKVTKRWPSHFVENTAFQYKTGIIRNGKVQILSTNVVPPFDILVTTMPNHRGHWRGRIATPGSDHGLTNQLTWGEVHLNSFRQSGWSSRVKYASKNGKSRLISFAWCYLHQAPLIV